MKKSVLLIFGVVSGVTVILLISLYLYFYQPFQPDLQPAALLPRNTLFMVRADNLKAGLDRIRVSPIGQELAKVNWAAVYGVLGVSEQQAAQHVDLLNQISLMTQSPWFNAVFGRSVTVAAVPRAFEAEVQVQLPDLVVVARVRHPVGVLQEIGELLAKDLSFTHQVFQGHNLVQVDDGQGGRFYYAQCRKSVVAAIKRQTILACLQRLETPDHTLTADSDYQRTQQALPESAEAPFYGYWHIGRSLGMVNQQHGLSRKQINSISGLVCAAWVGWAPQADEWRQKIVAFTNRRELPPKVAQWIQATPEVNPIAAMIPADLLVFCGVSLDLEGWSQINPDFNATFYAHTGIPPQAFGRHFGIVVTDVSQEGWLPIPKLALIAQVRDADEVLAGIHRLAAQAGMSLRQSEYQGIPVWQADFSLSKALSPSFAMQDGYGILTSNQEQMQTILNTSSEGECLNRHLFFKSMEQSNHMIGFARVDQLSAKLKPLMNMAGGMIPKQYSGKYYALRDEAMLPLLNGLQSISLAAVRLKLAQDHTLTELRIRLHAGSNPFNLSMR